MKPKPYVYVVLALLAACSSRDDASEEKASVVSASAVDAQIRADLRLALGVGARCHAIDAACRASVMERIARGDRSDATLAEVIDRVNRLDRADFCDELEPNARAVFAVGAGGVAGSNEVAVLFDLKGFAAAVATSAEGLADLQQGAAYETIANATGDFPAIWAGEFATAEPTLRFPEATLHWAGAGGIGGAARLAAKQEATRRSIASVSTIDGSTYAFLPAASATSALVLANRFEDLGAARKDGVVSFASKAKYRPGIATAIAIAEVAGLDGMGPRAAAMAITFDRAASLAGGVAAYCGKGHAALSTRSLGFDVDVDISLGTGFSGIEDRLGEGETANFDCTSGVPELQCGSLYGESTFCSPNGQGSCCRAPITDTTNLERCTLGPGAGCRDGKVCTLAAEAGPTANTYVCVRPDTCEAVNRTPVAEIDDKKQLIACDAATPAQQTVYATALKRARCAASIEACAALIRSASNPDPKAVLDTVKVHLSCALPNATWNAYTSGIGEGASAKILLSKDRYYALDELNHLLILLHELAHATGRVNKGHGPLYPSDPTTEEEWVTAWANACALSRTAETKCGFSWE
jgi:hypothetical protein